MSGELFAPPGVLSTISIRVGKKGLPSTVSGWAGPPVAVLWPQSLLWGLLCIDTLSMLEIPYRLLSAAEICEDLLEQFWILIVPGGWAAHKARALGETGRLAIAGFIDEGGSYVGFCGGAGLALSSPPALYLAPVRRMPLSERLPSASGEIYVSGDLSHPAWGNMPVEVPVSVWWPSQFQLDPHPARFPAPCKVSCLASYTAPGAGFQVADLRVCDVVDSAGWRELERTYGINLDPARIEGHPAIIEIERGKGRLVLSYAHLETPGDAWGNRLFWNILNYLNEASSRTAAPVAPAAAAVSCGLTPRGAKSVNGSPLVARGNFAGQGGRAARIGCGGSPLTRLLSTAGSRRRSAEPSGARYPASGISRARQAAADLIAFGEANLLWNWRKPWLLNWRRGIRGLEYGTLFVTLACMAHLEQKLPKGPRSKPGPPVCGPDWPERTKELEDKTLEFCALAKRLLFEEKIAAGTGTAGKLGKVNEKVAPLRSSLFGDRMNPGGLCGALFDLIDRMLLDQIQAASRRVRN